METRVGRVGYASSAWPAVQAVPRSVLEMRARVKARREGWDAVKTTVWTGCALLGLSFWTGLGLLIGLRGLVALLVFLVGNAGLWLMWSSIWRPYAPWRRARLGTLVARREAGTPGVIAGTVCVLLAGVSVCAGLVWWSIHVLLWAGLWP